MGLSESVRDFAKASIGAAITGLVVIAETLLQGFCLLLPVLHQKQKLSNHPPSYLTQGPTLRQTQVVRQPTEEHDHLEFLASEQREAVEPSVG